MSKITINQLHMALCEANSIMLTVHIRPDGDAIGSMVAFYEALVGQGKTVYMVVDDVVPEKYTFLRYTDHIHDVAYFETNPVDIGYLVGMLMRCYFYYLRLCQHIVLIAFPPPPVVSSKHYIV